MIAKDVSLGGSEIGLETYVFRRHYRTVGYSFSRKDQGNDKPDMQRTTVEKRVLTKKIKDKQERATRLVVVHDGDGRG